MQCFTLICNLKFSDFDYNFDFVFRERKKNKKTPTIHMFLSSPGHKILKDVKIIPSLFPITEHITAIS